MTAADPRHGTNAGYLGIPCREFCCRLAHANDQRARRAGLRTSTAAVGVRRRLQALQALGWRLADIAEAGGWEGPQSVSAALYAGRDRAHQITVRNTLRAYDVLSMRLGPSDQVRFKAARNGWPPPLAWDDDTIDDAAARPAGVASHDWLIDDVIVHRALNGRRVKANPAERVEVIRRWKAAGRPLNELERIQGWNARRDLRRSA